MDDAVRSAAYGKVAKAGGWTGLGCLQVALKKKKKRKLIIYTCLCTYTFIHTTNFLGLHHRSISIKNGIEIHYLIYLHIILLGGCSVTFSKSKFTLDTQSSN